ncbi:MAG: pilus assembly protein TadG-related protein, partial [Pontixanthobacter sp.]
MKIFRKPVTNVRTPGMVRRLLRDRTANTLAITAASVLPLIGVVGGGVDTGRIYLAKSRLQQACDSATLAARKQLGARALEEGGIPGDLHDTADNFFRTNFQTGTYGTRDTTYELSHSSGTQMDGEASTKVPTTLMSVFGYDDVDIDVDCSADLNLPNIDIVLVLDMSGSMSLPAGSGTRMAALQEAVFAFYDEIMAVKPVDARVRIGIVPYNSNINVGETLMALNPDYVSDTFTYQSRVPNFEIEETYSDRREPVPREKAWLGSTTDFDYSWSSNRNHSQYGQSQCDAYDGTYTVNGERWVISNDDWEGNYFPSRHSSATGACIARVVKYHKTPIKKFVDYTYKPRIMGVHDGKVFKQGGTITTDTGIRGANEQSRWRNCIEETTTVATTNFDPVPNGAFDLNIDHIPTPGDVDTQWRPIWEKVTYDRFGSSELTTTADNTRFINDRDANKRGWLRSREATCPQRTHQLQTYDLDGSARNADFERRINALRPEGGTLHDIGMIWGGRLISPDGIFAGSNGPASNGEPIVRHLIFMTDGQMGANPFFTTAYGNYDMDERFAGRAPSGQWGEDELAVIHNSRLDAVCQSIKNKNVTIWTLSFTLPLNKHTRGCATGDNRAMQADDRDKLI